MDGEPILGKGLHFSYRPMIDAPMLPLAKGSWPAAPAGSAMVTSRTVRTTVRATERVVIGSIGRHLQKKMASPSFHSTHKKGSRR